MITRMIEKHGRRRSILALIGFVWIFIAMGILISPVEVPISGLPHTYIPRVVRFLLWVISGAVAVAVAFTKSDHGRAEAVGFALLYVMPAERLVSYLISWASTHSLVPGEGVELGWLFSLQYLCYVGVIYICAGWTDPPKEV